MGVRDGLTELDRKVGASRSLEAPPAWQPSHGPVRPAGLTPGDARLCVALGVALVVTGVACLVSAGVGRAGPFIGPAVGSTVGLLIGANPRVRRRFQRTPYGDLTRRVDVAKHAE